MSLLCDYEIEILALINAHRARLRLTPLATEPSLQTEAEAHSTDMAEAKQAFGHGGFEQRAERLSTQGNFQSLAENVAYGQQAAQQLLDSWLNSPEHRQNIEGDFQYTGISARKDAQGRYFYTQLFGKRPGLKPGQASDGNLGLEMLLLINKHRQEKGLRALHVKPQIQSLAEAHSRAMASGQCAFGHSGFEQRAAFIQTLFDGSIRLAENVLSGQGSANELLQAWLNSPSHRKNIEGDFGITGLSAVQNAQNTWFLTQIFVSG